MKQKSIRGVKKGKKPAVRQPKKHDPIPAQWWRPGIPDAKMRKLAAS